MISNIEAPQDQLSKWLLTPLGQYILRWEEKQYARMTADLFGFNAVQIGLPQTDFLQANRMPVHIRQTQSAAKASEDNLSFAQPARPSANKTELATGMRRYVIADAAGLPYAAKCIDLIVMPHVLEYCPEPHQVLREVERVLMPEGNVVITGFNPVSLWGLEHKIHRKADLPPWAGRYISVRCLKDWFSLLGIEACGGAFGCYQPALQSEYWRLKLQFLEKAGSRWWPITGAVYALQGVKRIIGTRLVGNAWKRKSVAKQKLVPANQPFSQD